MRGSSLSDHPARARAPWSRARRTWLALAALLVAGLAVGVLAAVDPWTDHAGPVPQARLAPPGFRPSCPVSATLVPECGRWWGVAPLAHTDAALGPALRVEEDVAGRPLDILHTYHRNTSLFPDATERALALQTGRNRLLLINWKPATDMTWRAVADGGADTRIDRLASYTLANFRHRFFLAIWHEPENEVDETPGSGMTALDYAAMYRHVVERLRAKGLTYAVTVMDYIGFDKWANQPWFAQLWPGDSVVDWIGLDPYGAGAATGYNARDLATLVNRPEGSFPGYYTWATETHPGKPIMLAEWGVEFEPSRPEGQARFFADVGDQLHRFPRIKALVYFDVPGVVPGQPNTSLRSNAETTAAYRELSLRADLRAPAVPLGP